jgi:DNA repair protein RadA/Sms
VLYASGEESEHQIKSRGDRLGVGTAPLYLLAETCIERILEEIARLKPSLVIVDSVQTVWSPGSSRRRAASGRCGKPPRSFSLPPRPERADGAGGHVTKDGSLAGRKYWSTWWTPCCRSRANATTRIASCGRSRTGSAR